MLHKSNIDYIFHFDYVNENESCASTNKDSNMASSIKGNNYYNFFRNSNEIKRNPEYKDYDNKENGLNNNNIKIQSYISQKNNKENKIKISKNPSRTKSNYYPKRYSYFNNYKKNNVFRNSLINKTINVLNLKKGTFNQKISKFEFNNYSSFRHNQINLKKKAPEKIKFNEKINRTQNFIKNKKIDLSKNVGAKTDKKKNTNTEYSNKKYDFNNEKKKLELIKKQYIKNIKNTKIIFHDIKHKMSNITEYQKNILDLNNKCLKYTSLSQEDNLRKYKEENIKNLNEYKLKKEEIMKRPFSCDDKKEKRKKNKKVKKKILNVELMNKREKREKELKEKFNNIKNYNNIKSKCYNSLRFFNEILDKNKEKKMNFHKHLKEKINNNKIQKRYFSQNISAKIKL